MVLTTKVGKKRPFSRGLLLSIVTLGIYGIYWAYKAHDEVHKQFELDKEGRDNGILWLILGILIGPLVFVYYYKFIENVRYVRERLRLPQSFTFGKYIGLTLLSFAVIFGSVITFVAASVGSASGGADEPAAALFLVVVVGYLAALAIIAYTYYRIQTDVNGVWDAYDAQIATLTHGAAPPGPPAPPTA